MNWRTLAAEVCDSDQSCLEINGSRCVEHCGGTAVLWWFDDKHAAVGNVVPNVADIADWTQSQYIIHVDKSRQATLDLCHYVWSRIPVGASLFLCGPNELGIKSTIKHVAALTGEAATLMLNKQRARVVRFIKQQTIPVFQQTYLQVPADEDDTRQLWTMPGVFSANELDKGTALMQDCLADISEHAGIIDMACGVGHLGLYLLDRWPQSQCLFLDADYRAITCLEKNIAEFSYQKRAHAQWWSAGEQVAHDACDLVIMNPPAHTGKQVDYHAAFTMFQQGYACLNPGGAMYIIANIQLPYEQELKKLTGTFTIVCEEDGFKVMCVRKAN